MYILSSIIFNYVIISVPKGAEVSGTICTTITCYKAGCVTNDEAAGPRGSTTLIPKFAVGNDAESSHELPTARPISLLSILMLSTHSCSVLQAGVWKYDSPTKILYADPNISFFNC
jgi:hypothetical protein